MPARDEPLSDLGPVRWAKAENEVPVGVTRTYVKYVDVGTFPSARRDFQVARCNQCADAPCVTASSSSGSGSR